jgi:hypothetical protein
MLHDVPTAKQFIYPVLDGKIQAFLAYSADLYNPVCEWSFIVPIICVQTSSQL